MQQTNRSARGLLISAVIAAVFVIAAYLFLTPTPDDDTPDSSPPISEAPPPPAATDSQTATTGTAPPAETPPADPPAAANEDDSPEPEVSPEPEATPISEAPPPPAATDSQTATTGTAPPAETPPADPPAAANEDDSPEPEVSPEPEATPISEAPPPPAATDSQTATTGTAPPAETPPADPPAAANEDDSPEPEVSPEAPLAFDIVRIDESGYVVLAGRAAPGSQVTILLNGEAQTEVEAGSDGSFVAFFAIPSLDGAPSLRLLETSKVGKERLSEDSVLVLMVPPDGNQQTEMEDGESVGPIALLETDLGLETLEPQPIDNNLTLDLLTFDQSGAVVLTGHGLPGSTLFIYIDNDFVAEIAVNQSGSWSARLPAVQPGEHMLRIDQLDESASVINRLEMLFNPDVEAVEEDDLITTDSHFGRRPQYIETELVVVRKGYTLWGISRSKYGLGRLYVTIFRANDHLIKDPDLIYPGQIFIIPKQGS